ncbi:acetate uptake transporter [Acholeplasma hippikon]|uniref:Inner membrane protein yaaH n=1 Tax=Acholeplasma hippikon TaxID=264636 RepID=A0A449BIQ4_9MOLU|nr:GPR1/FUN34/YaaH family transporter [Acholeplasma hippikon]VEU82339.1 Inner membrane protein yaaH [Acholeplasma hippikon]
MHKNANPAPLGLLGFGMTTILLNLHNAGITELNLTIIAMGIALGGLAQVIAGILEFKANNTFGGTAFTAYGLFWLSLVMIWVMPYEYESFISVNKTDMGFYLLLWGIFTFFMTIGTLKQSTTNKLVFGSLTLLFILLSIGDFANSSIITNIAGFEGIVCGLLAMYGAVAQVVNEQLGKQVLPL